MSSISKTAVNQMYYAALLTFNPVGGGRYNIQEAKAVGYQSKRVVRLQEMFGEIDTQGRPRAFGYKMFKVGMMNRVNHLKKNMWQVISPDLEQFNKLKAEMVDRAIAQQEAIIRDAQRHIKQLNSLTISNNEH